MALYSKEKGKYWYYRFKYKDINGKEREKNINTYIPKDHTSKREMSKAEAIGIEAKKAFLTSLENEKLRVNGLNSDIDYSLYTLEEYIEHWLHEIQYEIRESTVQSYKQEINAHILPILGNIVLKDISINTIKYFFDTEFNDCLKKMERNEKNYMQSIKKHLCTLSSILDFAVEENAIFENPVPKVKKRLVKKLNQYKITRELEPYSWDELMQLKEIVLKANTHIESAVIIAIYTGLRKEEILGLRWQDVNFEDKTLHIRNTCTKVGSKIVYSEKTKTSKSKRIIPMFEDLYNYLTNLQKKQKENRNFFGDGYIDTDLICVWADGKPIKPDNLSRQFKKILTSNNLRIIRFYDLRHSFGSVLFNATGDIKVVSDLLGHSNISTTSDIYVKTNEQHKANAIKTINNKMGNNFPT